MRGFDPEKRRTLAGVATMIAVSALHSGAIAASRPDLEKAADETLARLIRSQPASADLLKQAKGVMVFPEIVKGGLLVGAATGEGVLRIGRKTEGYYRSSAVSYGMQLGFARFGYVMMLMDAASLNYVRKTDGWEVGAGPNVTVADKGFAKKLSTSSTRSGIYVFFVNQQGFFGGAGIEGAKISRIDG